MVVSKIFYFHPYLGFHDPIWRAYFSEWFNHQLGNLFRRVFYVQTVVNLASQVRPLTKKYRLSYAERIGPSQVPGPEHPASFRLTTRCFGNHPVPRRSLPEISGASEKRGTTYGSRVFLLDMAGYEALCFWEGFGFEVMNAFGNQVCKRFKNLEATKCMLKDLFLKWFFINFQCQWSFSTSWTLAWCGMSCCYRLVIMIP